jgi:CheY-like chemotaxis protein
LVSLVLAHHTPKGRAERSKTDERFLHVMQVGEAIANLSDNPAPQRYQTLAQLLESYGVDRAQQCKACVAEAVAKTAESSRLFSIPVPDDAAMLRLLQKATGGDGPQRTFAPNAARAADVAAAEPAEPAVPEPVPLTIPTRPSRQPAAARRQVLLIDDDKALCRSVLRTLAAAGLEAQTCQTGAEARMLAEQAAVILCDVHLESDSGIGLVRELRAGGFTGPVLMISGDCSRATVQECIEAGVADYLIKPFNRAALLEKLRKHAGWIFQSPVPPPTFPTHVSDQAVVGGSVKDSGG